MNKILIDIFDRLFAHFGPQHWWPADSDFEIIVGAILTQNTAWTNVEKAMANLKCARLLTPTALKRVPVTRLARLIRPSGYFNLKAKKLKAFVHFLFAQHRLRTAVAARVGSVELHCTPRVDLPFFRGLRRRFGVRLRSQGRGDLGTRMHRSFKRALRRHPAAVLIGSDCPALRAADLRAAVRALRGGADAVLAPAEDGGYPLIGLRRLSPRLFHGMPWGSAQVMGRTRRRLAALHWHWRELRTLWDVDRPEDVRRLRRSGVLRER